MDYKEILSGGVNWIKISAAGFYVLGATMNTAKNIRLPSNVGNFFTSFEIVCF